MSMTPIRIAFTLSGRPLGRTTVVLGGFDAALETDAAGVLEVGLPGGRVEGEVHIGEQRLPFTFVNASGRRAARVDLREAEVPIDDERVRSAMPADRYVPIKLLGRGAAGAVYKVRDTVLDRLVAIKLLSEEFASSEDEFDAFLGEARSLARIDHPNLIDIYDLGRHRGRVWMAVEFLDGPDLETLTLSNQRLPSGSAAAAGVQLMRALHAIHLEGFIHRDVKPSNGLVSRDGRVRLADFGLVRPLVDFTDPRSRIFGTPAYMSPEQLQARPLGPASDIYGLGATLFHMAAGRLPFNGPNPILAHITDPAPSLAEVVPDCAPELANVILEMMAKDPDARPHAEEVIERLVGVATTVPYAETSEYLPRLHTSDIGADTRSDRAQQVRAATRERSTIVVDRDGRGAAPIVSVDAEPLDPPIAEPRRAGPKMAVLAALALVAGVGGYFFVTGGGAAPEGTDAEPGEVVADDPPAPPESSLAAADPGVVAASPTGEGSALAAAEAPDMPDADEEPVAVALAWRDIGAGVRAADTVARLTAAEPDPATPDPEPAAAAPAPSRAPSSGPGRAPTPTPDPPSEPAPEPPVAAAAPAAPSEAPSAGEAPGEGEPGADAAEPVEDTVVLSVPIENPDAGSAEPATPDPVAAAAPEAGTEAQPDEEAEPEAEAEPEDEAPETGRGRRDRGGDARPPVTF